MIKKSIVLNKDYMKPGELASLLGVKPKTISNYCDNGLIKFIKTDGGHRLLDSKSVAEFLDRKNMLIDDFLEKRFDIIYGRVSTKNQEKRGDLNRQVTLAKLFAVEQNPMNLMTLTDIGSGFNDKRKNLNKLLKYVMDDKVSRIFITHKDRLTRCGFGYIEMICNEHNTQIVVMSDMQEKSESEELAEDIISLIHHYSGKLYGMRRHITKETLGFTKDQNDEKI